MSVPLGVLRRLQRALGGTLLCGDTLVVAPTEHILRGFLLERTLEKGMYFLWRVVMPLYRPATTVILNYSSRIPCGEKFHITRQNTREVSEHVLPIILNEHLAYLQALREPRDFLKHIGPMIGNTTTTFRLDLALTHYMQGSVAECTKILEGLAAEGGAPAPAASAISGLLDELKTNPARAAQRIEAWERLNIANLGLAPTVAGTAT